MRVPAIHPEKRMAAASDPDLRGLLAGLPLMPEIDDATVRSAKLRRRDFDPRAWTALRRARGMRGRYAVRVVGDDRIEVRKTLAHVGRGSVYEPLFDTSDAAGHPVEKGMRLKVVSRNSEQATLESEGGSKYSFPLAQVEFGMVEVECGQKTTPPQLPDVVQPEEARQARRRVAQMSSSRQQRLEQVLNDLRQFDGIASADSDDFNSSEIDVWVALKRKDGATASRFAEVYAFSHPLRQTAQFIRSVLGKHGINYRVFEKPVKKPGKDRWERQHSPYIGGVYGLSLSIPEMEDLTPKKTDQEIQREKDQSYDADVRRRYQDLMEQKRRDPSRFAATAEARRAAAKRTAGRVDGHYDHICRDTLKLSDIGASVLGGPDKPEAVAYCRKNYGDSWTRAKLKQYGHSDAEIETLFADKRDPRQARRAASTRTAQATDGAEADSDDDNWGAFYAEPLIAKVLSLDGTLASRRQESGDGLLAFELAEALAHFAHDWNSHEPLIQEIWGLLRRHKAQRIGDGDLASEEHEIAKEVYDLLETNRAALESWARDQFGGEKREGQAYKRPADIDDDEIEMWVNNDEGLYNWMHDWSRRDPRAADDDGTDEWDGDMVGFIEHNRVELQRRIWDTLHGDRPNQGYGDPRHLMGQKQADGASSQSLSAQISGLAADEKLMLGDDIVVYYDFEPARGDRGHLVPGATIGRFEVVGGPWGAKTFSHGPDAAAKALTAHHVAQLIARELFKRKLDQRQAKAEPRRSAAKKRNIPYKGYEIVPVVHQETDCYKIKFPNGEVGSDIAANLATAKRWIDLEIHERRNQKRSGAESRYVYVQCMFAQGEDANELLDMLDEKGESKTLTYIVQNYCDSDGDVQSDPPWGTSDQVYKGRGGWILSYNTRLGYIGVCRREKYVP